MTKAVPCIYSCWRGHATRIMIRADVPPPGNHACGSCSELAVFATRLEPVPEKPKLTVLQGGLA